MSENQILSKAKQYVEGLFYTSLSDNYKYHNLQHTLSVVECCNNICFASNITTFDREKILLAAYFHDTGFIRAPQNHEEISVEIATRFLKENNFPDSSINEISKIILATKPDHLPETLPEKVIRDADISHAGSENFSRVSQNLRLEWEFTEGKILTDEEWYRINLNFLNSVKFYTQVAKISFSETLERNKLKVAKRLKKSSSKQEKKKKSDNKAVTSPVPESLPGLNIPPKNLKDSLDEKKTTRGIETLFRITSRNHIDLSSIADNKANIMISVNAIIISIVISTLIGRIQAYPHLIAPTIILLFFSLVATIFAVLSTRPKINNGFVSKEDIENKRGNLLFFGNFYKMSPEDYEFGVKNLMNNADYLYGSLIRDLYYLGVVLERKYRFLRISYDVFITGLVISVVTFVLAFILE